MSNKSSNFAPAFEKKAFRLNEALEKWCGSSVGSSPVHSATIALKIEMLCGVVVQLVRIPACHAVGREFESRPHRQNSTDEKEQVSVLCLSISPCFFF